MSSKIMSAVLAGWCSWVLAACSHDFRLMQQEEYLSQYGDAIRWSQFWRVADFQSRPSSRQAVSDNLDQVQISSYTPLYRQEQDDGRLLLQTVEIRYIRKRDLLEHHLIDHQRWRFDTDQSRWLLESELPRFE